MRICFFTEGGHRGQIPKHTNMRTDHAWMYLLNADHCPVAALPQLVEQYDIGIIIIPKLYIPIKNHEIDRRYTELPIVEHLKRTCKKYAVMQESTYWIWQDAEIDLQVWFYNICANADFLLTHNHGDVNYFKGMFSKNTHILQSAMLTDDIKTVSEKIPGVVIGGNFTSIYRGFDSYVAASSFSEPVYAPSTGRKREMENDLDITHLPWMDWSSWMTALSQFKWAVQLGTPAAGTFNMNCSYLGIPCIGYDNLYTQKILHPDLAVEDGDVYTARLLAEKLQFNKSFYDECSQKTRELFQQHFSEDVFRTKTFEILKQELNN